ncbi:MAG: hypothetical protein PF442_08540 [Desulfobulbaceae bacterium]|jgi:hypothetical protein|nr:hypothetical protein [Desulfobulbaceae bacterium]
MNKEKSKREQEAILRRAIIAAKSEYFSWTDKEQEKYRAQRKLKDDFIFYKTIFMELFGFKAETQEELDAYYDERSIYDPHSGGVTIPQRTKESTEKRILAYAQKNYVGKFTRLDIRFRSQFCYIGAYIEPIVPYDFPPDFSESREEFIERRRNTPMPYVREEAADKIVYAAF